MEQTSLDPHSISSREKKFKSNRFWNIENEDEGTNTTWRGKDTLFRKHCGNRSRYFWTMETFWPTTNSTTIYEYPSCNHLAPLDIRKHENEANMEAGQPFGPSQMGLEILQMV